LTDDLAGFQYRLDQYYAGLTNWHNSLVGPNAPWANNNNMAGGPNYYGSSDPALARNGVGTGYRPQPVGTFPNMAGVPPGQQPVNGSQPAVGLQGQGAMTPRLGMPVKR
jgi:hypothetical protein